MYIDPIDQQKWGLVGSKIYVELINVWSNNTKSERQVNGIKVL